MSYRFHRHQRHHRHHWYYRPFYRYHYPRVHVITQDYGWYILIGLIVIAAVLLIKF